MTALQSLLTQYRYCGFFPTYAQLIGLCVGLAALDKLLLDYREGADFPTYEQLQEIAAA